MSVTVEFHFDFGSPNAYLPHKVIPAIELRTGVPSTYVPVLLGGVFKATGNVSPAESMRGIRNKPEYAALETARFVARHHIRDFERNPHFPVNTLRRHMWAEPKKMDDPEVMRDALQASGLPMDDILRGIEDAAVKQALIASTEASVARGTFGSPSVSGAARWRRCRSPERGGGPRRHADRSRAQPRCGRG